LKIPQDLDYTAWNYRMSEWPFTILGGEYRFEFYKLVPAWVIDTQPPTVHYVNVDIKKSDSGPMTLYRSFYEIKARVTDDFKITNVLIQITIPGGGTYKMESQPSAPSNIFRFPIIPIYDTDMSAPVTATITVVATDISGNKSETQFQSYFAAGFPEPAY
jgi:hypothetical protein